MKRRIKEWVCLFLYVTGITPLLLRLRFLDRGKILILLYHRVRNPEDGYEAAVSPARFEEQLGFLRERFQVVSLTQALEMKKKSEKSVKPLAVITFDDGYRDNWEAAYPILKRYSLPATFFLAAGSIGNEAPMWTSRVEALFRETPRQTLTLETLSSPRTFELGSREERMKVCYEVKNEMKNVPDNRRQVILEELEEKASDPSLRLEEIHSEMLSWDEVRRLAEDPLVEIGSHSMSHRMLANLPPPEILSELEESKRKIESEIGREIRFLSYPGNSYNEKVQELAQRAGYQAALAVGRSVTSFQENDFSLKRVHVEDGPRYVFQAEICQVLSFLRSFFNPSQSCEGGVPS